MGAGQAGVAMSEHLSRLGVPHLVLERNRIAEAWRTGRWDSLVANGPAWHDRFPGLEFAGLDPDAFAGKDQVADYFETYARKFNAPIRTGVEVRKVVRNANRPGFTVDTSDGVIEARQVVVATGPFQCPVIPPIAPQDPRVLQMHSAAYRNPQQLPEGAVLVVGRAPRGCRSPMNCNAPASRSTSRSAPMTVRRGPTATVISAGGWGCSASGMPRPCSRARST
ncbi:Putative monooxygenase [Pseudomonas chlororaphis subsp. aurantiaca]|nr:Putative monooxygenase [Pseudomonas chlororaphis subsp. aurantiaca]